MKQWIAFLLILCLGLTGCSQPGERNIDFTKPSDTAPPVADALSFTAQYIRTDGYHEAVEYPIVTVIRSAKQLDDYYNANKALYDLDSRPDPGADYTIGFLDACQRYDDAFFREQALVLVLLEEGSGSTRHKVDSATMTGNQLDIRITTIEPEVGTCDMAQWHIFIELANVSDDVTVYLDGVDPRTQAKIAEHSKGYANIRLTVPHGWKYEITERGEYNDFGISFWPEGETEGKVTVYHQKNFGVCGTGLTVKDITLGRYEASQGSYGSNWDYIILGYTPGTYVVMNEGANIWWGEYGQQAMEILSTLLVGDGIIDAKEAIRIAKAEANEVYEKAHAEFDTETGLWQVYLYNGSDHTAGYQVTVTHEGKVLIFCE